MHNIVIGIDKNKSLDLERFIDNVDYVKFVNDEKVHIRMDVENWNHPNNPLPSTLNSYLALVIGEDNYGFIRLGNALDDIEIHGSIEKFNMTVERCITELYE